LGLGVGQGGKAIAAVNKTPSMIVFPLIALNRKRSIEGVDFGYLATAAAMILLS
jgi:hypothetical protein